MLCHPFALVLTPDIFSADATQTKCIYTTAWGALGQCLRILRGRRILFGRKMEPWRGLVTDLSSHLPRRPLEASPHQRMWGVGCRTACLGTCGRTRRGVRPPEVSVSPSVWPWVTCPGPLLKTAVREFKRRRAPRQITCFGHSRIPGTSERSRAYPWGKG